MKQKILLALFVSTAVISIITLLIGHRSWIIWMIAGWIIVPYLIASSHHTSPKTHKRMIIGAVGLLVLSIISQSYYVIIIGLISAAYITSYIYKHLVIHNHIHPTRRHYTMALTRFYALWLGVIGCVTVFHQTQSIHTMQCTDINRFLQQQSGRITDIITTTTHPQSPLALSRTQYQNIDTHTCNTILTRGQKQQQTLITHGVITLLGIVIYPIIMLHLILIGIIHMIFRTPVRKLLKLRIHRTSVTQKLIQSR